MPLSIHYGLSRWILFPLAFYVVRYRRNVVRKNLRNAFPNLTSPFDLFLLERRIYLHLAEVVAETIYGYSISDDEMRERVSYHNLELVERLAKQYGGVMVMLGHYGNWEWFSDIAKRVNNPAITVCSVYRELKNKAFDQLMADIRAQRGTDLTEKKHILREMVRRRKEGIVTLYGMISDQKPSPQNAHYWTQFLHQDTSFLDGSEVLGRKFGYPVVMCYVTSPCRGYYNADLRLLSEHPNEETDFAVTERYARMLEQNILQQPELWLWTHNRWKYKREEV